MTRRAAIAALALAVLFAAVGARYAHAEWVTEVVTNVVAEYNGVPYLKTAFSNNDHPYIDTGFVQGSRNDLVFSIRYRLSRLNQWAAVMGNNIAETAASTRIICYNGTQNRICVGYNRTSSSQNSVYDLPTNSYVTAILKLRSFDAYDDSGSLLNHTDLKDPSGDSNSESLSLFMKYSYSSELQISDFKITTTNGSILMRFIPVLHNGAGKMLNLVDGQLYANAGTGAFAYGAVTGKVAYVSITTNRVYRAPAPMRSYDAQHPFNAPTARTRLGGTGSGEDGTTLRPSAHFDIKRNEED